jgi:DNA-binding MarR family transcriptional regulator
MRYTICMGANTSNATRDVLDAVRRIVQTLHESSRRAEAQLGVSGAQLFVLQRLSESPGASLNELAARTHTHQSSVSAVVTRLVARGLVRRSTAADDARRLVLSLTPTGHRLVLRAPHAAQDRLITAVNKLSLPRRALLADVLTDLAQAVAGVRRAEMFFEDKK